MNIIQIYETFPTKNSCIKHLEKVRWNDKPTCPYCNSTIQTPMGKENRYHCNTCNTSYSVTVGTIFHKTKLDLQKWFLAVTIVLNSKKGISSRQLSGDLEVNKNTGWYLLMRIRKAMLQDAELLKRLVEADESYIGGKAKNKQNRGGGGTQGRNTKEKITVDGVVERDRNMKVKVVGNVSSKTLKFFVKANVELNTTVCADEWRGYNELHNYSEYLKVDRSSNQYVNGIIGQYHQVSRKHLQRYIDEFCFRYNNKNIPSALNLILQKGLGV